MLPLTVYMAGELFDIKHLTGNILLAQAIERLSDGRLQPLLPQDVAQEDLRSVAIRNNDLHALLNADVGLFHFDGSDADSGTVAEFMIAKWIDMPSIILRTDFRNSGDSSGEDSDPWNLMVSGWPRTQGLVINALELYQQVAEAPDRVTAMQEVAAYNIIDAFATVLAATPVIENEVEMADALVSAVTRAGGGLDDLFTDESIAELAARKIALNNL